MPGIGIIVNPKGKKYRKNPEKIQRLSFIVGDRASYSATEDLHDLRRVAEEFKSRDIDILAIGGGDGTTHVVLTQFIEVYGEKPLPKVTFLRGGTMNTLANACHVKGKPEGILSNLIYKYHEGHEFESTEMDIMDINGKYGFIFGGGVVFKFMESYYQGMPPSPLKACWTLTHSISSALMNGKFARKLFEPFDGDVWVNGKKLPFANWSALYAGSIPVLGLKFRIFYHANEAGEFHMGGFCMPPRSILRFVPDMFLGKPRKCDGMIELPAREMRIELAKPMAYTIDGDMLPGEKNFLIKCGPRIHILVK